MTNERFKEIADRNKNNIHQLCFEYYNELKPQMSLNTFNQAFPMFLMRMNFGAIERGYEKVEAYLKNKYNYV